MKFFLFLTLILLQLNTHVSAQNNALGSLLDDAATPAPLSSGLSGSDSENSPSFEELARSLGGDDEFLPVEEAYQLSVTRNDGALLLDWVIADAYFLYGEQFRFNINGNAVTAALPAGKIAYDPIFEKDVEKHYHHVQAVIQNSDLSATEPFELSVTSQGCADAGLCYPPHTERFTVSQASIVPIITATAGQTPTTAGQSTAPVIHQQVNWGIALSMLAFAIFGGVILNLMPCVLPVLSLKALSLANSQHSHRPQGWSYTLGAVSTFVVIAAVLLAVRAAGQAVGWGFQLQSPSFITALIYLFFVMGLSLSGYITLGTRFMSVGQSLTEGNGLKQSYFTGALAAVVASPCTAPFMATALGYALTQPWWLALAIFAALGFGMALPLLLLSHAPQLGRWLPKPGAWMETFKQALAFPLYLTAIWLLWVLGRQLSTDAAVMVILGGLAIVFIFWLSQHLKPLLKFSALLSLLLAVAVSWHISQQQPETRAATASIWEPYDEQRLSELRQQGKPVFINMTADWCITCLANEKVVFTDTMLKSMKDKGIHLIKGDWTNYDPAITRLLERYGRGGVPLYLLYPPEASVDAQVLPQILRPSRFKARIEAISAKNPQLSRR